MESDHLTLPALDTWPRSVDGGDTEQQVHALGTIGSTQSDIQAQLQVLLSKSAHEQYMWSWIRIWEQVTTNVLTVVVVASLGAVFGLLYQRVFHFILVPTHLLAAVAFAGLGILLTVLVVGVLVYLYVRKHPLAASIALLAVLFGLADKRSGRKENGIEILTDTNWTERFNTALESTMQKRKHGAQAATANEHTENG